MAERHAEADEFQKALAGLDYPASQDAILQKARDKGGLDTEVIYVFEHLPVRTYESFDDIAAEIPGVYAAQGGLAGAGPAAPSVADNEDKRLIEKMADPRAGEPR